jgi:hypothetical protein
MYVFKMNATAVRNLQQRHLFTVSLLFNALGQTGHKLRYAAEKKFLFERQVTHTPLPSLQWTLFTDVPPLLIVFQNWLLWIPKTVKITSAADDWVLDILGWGAAILDVSIPSNDVCSQAPNCGSTSSPQWHLCDRLWTWQFTHKLRCCKALFP